MIKSESIQNLTAALVMARAEMPAAVINRTNPFLKNKYADLGSVIEASQPILAKHGLAITQMCVNDGDRVGVQTILVHKSGEYLGSTVTLPVENEKGKSSAQVAGSIVTYLRRYAMAAALCMYADDDDDGHRSAMGQGETKAKSNGRNGGNGSGSVLPGYVKSVVNRDGVPYVDLPSDKLTHMYRSLSKAIGETDQAEDKKALEYKRGAIQKILDTRAEMQAA